MAAEDKDKHEKHVLPGGMGGGPLGLGEMMWLNEQTSQEKHPLTVK